MRWPYRSWSRTDDTATCGVYVHREKKVMETQIVVLFTVPIIVLRHGRGRNILNTIAAQEIKRGGITAVDFLLEKGAVHVITKNTPSYVVMSESQYRDLVDDAREGMIARVRASQADIDAGRVKRYTNVADLMAAIDAREDDKST